MAKRNIILSALTVLFFASILAGTLFGQKIGDTFRPSVHVRSPEFKEIAQSSIIVINEEEIEVTNYEKKLIIPSETLLIEENGTFVYLLQEHNETFGSYYLLVKQPVNVEFQAGQVIVLSGLYSTDYIASEIPKGIRAGERIVPIFPDYD